MAPPPGPADRARSAPDRPPLRSFLRFHGPERVLHLTWFAFFLSFIVWFNFAPFAATIGNQLGLSKGQLLTLGLCNLALTVPARIFVGMALDRYGPRRVFRAILIGAAIPNTWFALSTSFESMVASRLLLSIVGAGFVVGIRMVAEWFPPSQLGTAEGIYGGWGNFGAAAAAFALPVIANVVGGPDGWRWAIAASGAVAAAYGLIYGRAVTDTPAGTTYVRARKVAALEVTTKGAVFGLAALTVPLWCAVAVILFRISGAGVLGSGGLALGLVVTGVLLTSQLVAIFRVNRTVLAGGEPSVPRYPFRSVAILSIAYFVTFGGELAVVTMLPEYIESTWHLGPALAGIASSSAAFLNLAARPAGGIFSDRSGNRRRTLSLLLAGVAIGYGAMSLLGPAWPVLGVIALSLACSAFGQAGNGAVYAIVPQINKRSSGQIAGMAGAYGNVGGIVFLTMLTIVGPSWFFLGIGLAGLVALIATHWLVDPSVVPVDLGAVESNRRGSDRIGRPQTVGAVSV